MLLLSPQHHCMLSSPLPVYLGTAIRSCHLVVAMLAQLITHLLLLPTAMSSFKHRARSELGWLQAR